MKFNEICTVCGSTEFSYTEVLWPELISDWGLGVHEVDYVNRQQGFYCVACNNNLRSMALAQAILKRFDFLGFFTEFIQSDIASTLKILEINEAGGLTPILAELPGHLLIKYPEYDMTNLPFEKETFDLVIHSDTLEHVKNPVQGLAECRKVLNLNGACIYTVPVIPERMTRSRDGLKDSFHGISKTGITDYLVQTEFGADMWVYVLKAGFKSLQVHSLEYPTAIAIEAEMGAVKFNGK